MKMRIFKSIIFVAVALLISCQKEISGVDKLPMQVAPTLAGETKGSLTTADLTDFYLQIVSDDAAYSYFEHASKDGSGAWTTPSKLFWKNETSPVSYCAARFGAYAFTADQFKNGVDLEIPADQRTQEQLNAADLLLMPAASKKYEDTTGGILPVTLSHGLAKVNFTLTLGPKFYDNLYSRAENPVRDFTVSGTELAFTFQPQTGAVSATADTKADILALAGAFTPGTAESKSATATYEAILVPQALAKGALKVAFKVGDYDYEWSNEDAITLEAGKTYDLAVSVVTAPVPEHSFVDMGNGLRWATCNVGASSPEEYGDFFAWAETETKYPYGYSQGTYVWQQAGIDLWYNITKYTFPDGRTDSNWYSGGVFIGDGKTSLADYGFEDDAARQKWGRSWRTPTPEEWQWLVDNCTWAWQTDYNGTGKTGMLVTSNAPGYEGNRIFLPAAGYLMSEYHNLEGDEGFYWSSSLDSSDVIKAQYLDLSNVTLYYVNSGLRYCGYSVRPVCN